MYRDYTSKLVKLEFELTVIQNLESEILPKDSSQSFVERASKMQFVSSLFQGKMGESLKELKLGIEEVYQAKLLKMLRDNVQMFESNLWEQDDSMMLLDVTMRIIRSSQPSEYTFMINELANARVRYVKLSFKETCKLLDT